MSVNMLHTDIGKLKVVVDKFLVVSFSGSIIQVYKDLLILQNPIHQKCPVQTFLSEYCPIKTTGRTLLD